MGCLQSRLLVAWITTDTDEPDLIAVLLARIAEDEAAARAALAPDEMHPYGDAALPRMTPEQVPYEVERLLGGSWGHHFARWDPARVLAECEAKRCIVETLRRLMEVE